MYAYRFSWKNVAKTQHFSAFFVSFPLSFSSFFVVIRYTTPLTSEITVERNTIHPLYFFQSFTESPTLPTLFQRQKTSCRFVVFIAPSLPSTKNRVSLVSVASEMSEPRSSPTCCTRALNIVVQRSYSSRPFPAGVGSHSTPTYTKITFLPTLCA